MEKIDDKKIDMESLQYQPVDMQKSAILEMLREKGFRITKQRETIVDIILSRDCSCCKEIYYLASKKEPNIGMATVYRLVNVLEEIGALKRKNAYQIDKQHMKAQTFIVELDDHTYISLNETLLSQIVEKGMTLSGFGKGRKVLNILIKNGELERA